MTSQINPNNIDGAYPVAGQDNNSQGFRDNFTGTKVNFQYAEDEINDLQAKVLLKTALTGSYLDNNMNDNLIYAAKIQDFSATKVAITTTTGSVQINYAAGHYQTLAPTGTVSLSFQNFPAAGSWGWLRLQIHVTNLAYAVTLPTAVSVGIDQLQNYNNLTRTITFTKTGYFEFEFTTSNGGSVITVQDLNRNMDPLYLSGSQNLPALGAVDLTKTITYFTTNAAETATMANGTEGQIKTLIAQNVSSGSMTITTVSPGWVGSGTISFTTTGSACTMQFVQGKWYCVGNNGAAFS